MQRTIRVELEGPSGDRVRLDTTDPKLIGPWLLAWFQNYEPGPYGIPVDFRLTIS